MPAQRPPILGVMFDLDDTLNDRAASWMAFVRLLAGASGHLGDCDLRSVHATILAADQGGYRPKEQLFSEMRDRLPWQSAVTAEAVEQQWRKHFPSCMVLREGVTSMLAGLKVRGMRTAIVTNGRTDAQQAKIEHMGIRPYVDVVVTSESVGIKKPEAGIFHAALSALKISAAEAIFVGDNPTSDIVGPAAVGIGTVWLANGRGWPAEYAEPDYRIDAFSELEAVIVAAGVGCV